MHDIYRIEEIGTGETQPTSFKANGGNSHTQSEWETLKLYFSPQPVPTAAVLTDYSSFVIYPRFDEINSPPSPRS